MRPNIIPAILEPSFDGIVEKVRRAGDHFSRVQIDLVDGMHAPTMTWPYAAGETMSGAARQLHNLNIEYDLDLMTHEPEQTIDRWLESDARRLTLHLSSTKRLADCARQARDAGREAFVAVTVDDNLDGLPDVGAIDGIQCMGIREVGKQGEPFDERAYALIRSVRERYPSLPIAVDGGVSQVTVPALASVGVDELMIGSSLFRGDIDRNAAAIEALLASSPPLSQRMFRR